MSERERPYLVDLLREIIVELEQPEPTIPTGIERLDELLDGGLRPGEVCVLAARPRVGKSAFALQVALNLARSGKAVSLWSLEMRPKQWARRALAAMSGVNPKRIRRGGDWIDAQDAEALSIAMAEFKKLPIYFAGGSSDPEGIWAEIDMHVHHKTTSLFIIDYLQLMDSPRGASSREQEVAALSRAIKLAANAFSIPILLLAQLNRNAEGKVPTLADLRESGAIEQDADEVLFLHRDTDPETHVLQEHGMGILAKNRDGESGIVRLKYNWREFRFDQDDAPPAGWGIQKRSRKRRAMEAS